MTLRPFYLLLAIFLLGACAETELASHVAKTAPVFKKSSDEHKGVFKVGKPYKIAGKTYTPRETYSHTETGVASWYGPGFHGKKTANGEIFDKTQLTAAHRTLQLPSLIRVTNLANGRSIVLRVNDRGPFSKGRVLDVSERAAELLDFKSKGTARVKIQVLSEESKAISDAAKRGEDVRGVEVAINENRLMRSQTRAPTIKPAVKPVAAPEPQLATKGLQLKPVQRTALPPNAAPAAAAPTPLSPRDLPFARPSIYVQAGAFGDEGNAMKFANSLGGFGAAKVYPAELSNGQSLYRVRIGPVPDQQAANLIVANLADAGKSDALIVVD